MAEKISPYATYGEKIIKLFARLLFSGQSYSLTELSRMLGCSKQTVLRLMDDIRRSYGVEVEETVRERNKYYRLRKPGKVPPALALTGSEMSVLLMCQAFARHLLGETMFEEAATAIEKNRVIAEAGGMGAGRHLTSFRPGSIDYTPHEKAIRTLLRAMELGMVCMVRYRSLVSRRSKTFLVMPLKIFSHNDTIYLSARYAGKPGRARTPHDYDPLLAIHRIRDIEMTDRTFDYPGDYDFDEIYNRNFGIIKDGTYPVEVELTGLSARYVAERTWSADQRIHRLDDETIRLCFSISSEREFLAWLLSFGSEARVVAPVRLAKAVWDMLEKMRGLYREQGGLA